LTLGRPTDGPTLEISKMRWLETALSLTLATFSRRNIQEVLESK
jgi:hypothetical protein